MKIGRYVCWTLVGVITTGAALVGATLSPAADDSGIHGAFLLRAGMKVSAPQLPAAAPVMAAVKLAPATNAPVQPATNPPVAIMPPPPPPPPHVPPPLPRVVSPPFVATKPISLPPPQVNVPLPTSVLVWDSEMKSIDAHEGDPEGKLSYSFTNVSKEPVVIRNVHPGCGCTTAQLPPLPWTIPAGGEGRFGVTINLHGKTGTFFKSLTVTTDKGIKSLNFRVNVLPVPTPQLTEADRANMLKTSQADRQAVLKGDCAVCHVKRGEGRYGQRLYDADCGICHEAEHRASMVPDLHHLNVPTSPEFWRVWIAHGKPGGVMPAFCQADGGPLNDVQINTLVTYLTQAMSPRPAPAPAPMRPPQAPPVPH